MLPLEGRIALVTGASRGIGAAIAKRLGAEGADVICVGRTLHRGAGELPGSLLEVVAVIESLGGAAVAVQSDINDARQRARLAQEVLDQFGRVDILVNNAAVGEFVPLEKVTDAALRWQFEVNVLAPFDLSQKLIPAMRKNHWGRIVNISSFLAENPAGPPYPIADRQHGPTLYGATKAALNRITSGLAAELEGTGIAVNSLAPVSAVRTERFASIMEAEPEARSASAHLQQEPIEVMAEAALALCLVDPLKTSGRTLYSQHYLAQIGRAVRTLDGKAVYVE